MPQEKELKKCSKCKKLLSKESFNQSKNQKDGLQPTCKECQREYIKKWRKKNREYLQEYFKGWMRKNYPDDNYMKNWYEKHPGYHKEYMRSWSKKESAQKYFESWRTKNPKYFREYLKSWRTKNREKYRKFLNTYIKNKRENDISFKLSQNMGRAVWGALKGKKSGLGWEKLVGYTLQDLMVHLEKQFDSKMNWDNYGSYWVVDHKKARSLFKYENPEDEEFKKCWALENLQPMEKITNIKKGNRYI